MPAVKIFFLILFAIIISVLAVKNMNSVELSYYDFQLNPHVLKAPLLVVALGFLVFGFVIAWFGGFIERVKLHSQLRKLSKSNQVLTEDLDRLKSAPAKELSERAE